MVIDMDTPTPVALQKSNERTLKILWSDSTSNEYDVRKLRYNCTCARCVNEWSGDRIVKFEDIPKNMKPIKIESVGNYAIKITWVDGHDSGIYSYQSLKNVLPPLTTPEPCTPNQMDEDHSAENNNNNHHHHHKGCSHNH